MYSRIILCIYIPTTMFTVLVLLGGITHPNYTATLDSVDPLYRTRLHCLALDSTRC